MGKKQMAKRIYILLLSTLALLFISGCEAAGIGTEVRLEGISMYLDGKLISGLPSQKADIVLKVALSKISISSAGSDTVIRLKPGDAAITIKPDGISITGVDPQKLKIEWQDTEQNK